MEKKPVSSRGHQELREWPSLFQVILCSTPELHHPSQTENIQKAYSLFNGTTKNICSNTRDLEIDGNPDLPAVKPWGTRQTMSSLEHFPSKKQTKNGDQCD